MTRAGGNARQGEIEFGQMRERWQVAHALVGKVATPCHAQRSQFWTMQLESSIDKARRSLERGPHVVYTTCIHSNAMRTEIA
jgi:hypothetical protein